MAATGSIRNAPSAEIRQLQAWARQRGAVRLPEVDSYFNELWRISTQLGYDPAIVAAQSSMSTSGWTSSVWRDRLNPANLGIAEDADAGLSFANGTDAARAHIVHLSAYVKGYEPRIRPYIYLDPFWQSIFESGHESSVRVAADLTGRWSPDPLYGHELHQHHQGILSAIRRPDDLPFGEPGHAPPPADVQFLETGNWTERRFGQHPRAIVFHASGNEDLCQLLSWYCNPISRASVHAVVGREGDIHLLVDSERAAWSNDDIKNPRRDIIWLNDAVAQNWSRGGPMSLNDFTLSIEYVAAARSVANESQYRSMIELSAYWRDRYEIPPSRGRVIRHSDINSVDRMHCPGQQFALARVIEALGGSPDDLGN